MRRRSYGSRWLGGGILVVGGAALIAAGPVLPAGEGVEAAVDSDRAAPVERAVAVAHSAERVTSGAAEAVEVVEAAAEAEAVLETQVGSASYYANVLAGRRTASGIPYDPSAAVAAHRQLPFGTRLRVHNLANDRTVEVEVVDRGPFAKGRILDLSRSAARELGFIRQGHTRVRIEVLEYGH